MDNIEYINGLARTMGVSLASDEVSHLEGKTRIEINRYIIGKKESVEATHTEDSDIPKVLKDIKPHLDEVTRNRDLSIPHVFQRISELKAYISDHQGKIRDYFTEIEEKTILLNALKENPSKFKSKWYDSILRSLSHPNFFLADIKSRDGSILVTYLTSNIRCGHIVRSKGYNHHVNLGHFVVAIELKRRQWDCYVNPLVKNISVEDYYHPHVSGQTICWGTAADPANTAYNNQDMYTLLSVIYSTLTQYNYENPYLGLWRFDVTEDTQRCDMTHTDIDRSDAMEDSDDMDDYVKDYTEMYSHESEAKNNMPEVKRVWKAMTDNSLPIPSWFPELSFIKPETFSKLYGKFVQFYKHVEEDILYVAVPYEYTGGLDNTRSSTRAIWYKFNRSNRDWGDRGLAKFEELASRHTLHEPNIEAINKGIDDKALVIGTLVIPSSSHSRFISCDEERSVGIVVSVKALPTESEANRYEVWWTDRNGLEEVGLDEIVGVRGE